MAKIAQNLTWRSLGLNLKSMRFKHVKSQQESASLNFSPIQHRMFCRSSHFRRKSDANFNQNLQDDKRDLKSVLSSSTCHKAEQLGRGERPKLVTFWAESSNVTWPVTGFKRTCMEVRDLMNTPAEGPASTSLAKHRKIQPCKKKPNTQVSQVLLLLCTLSET